MGTVQWLKTNKKVTFVEWCPTGFKVGLNEIPAAQVKDDEMAMFDRNVVMIGNNTAPDAFPPEGGPTWACHRGCGDYTIWRIKADQVENVPAADKPASWN